MFQHIKLETTARIATLTLHRATPNNWLDYEAVNEMSTACELVENDPESRVMLIRSGQENFCAGVDPEYLFKLQQLGPADNIGESLFTGNLFQKVLRHKRLVVAAVKGQALSEGAALTCCADYVIATPTAQFGFPDVRYANIPAVSLYFALKKLSPAVARRLFLSGETVSAAEAKALGWVNEVVDEADLDAYARTFSLRVAQETSVGSVELLKKLVADLPAMPHAEAMEFAAKINGHGRTHIEFVRGLQARHQGKEIQW